MRCTGVLAGTLFPGVESGVHVLACGAYAHLAPRCQLTACPVNSSNVNSPIYTSAACTHLHMAECPRNRGLGAERLTMTVSGSARSCTVTPMSLVHVINMYRDIMSMGVLSDTYV
eukprot:jgi/Ulvmu1/12021/UM083_0034.1